MSFNIDLEGFVRAELARRRRWSVRVRRQRRSRSRRAPPVDQPVAFANQRNCGVRSVQMGESATAGLPPAVAPGKRGPGEGIVLEPPRSTRVGATGRFELDLPRTLAVPRLARQWLAEWLAPELSDPKLSDAKLLTDELVTNALVHGRGRIVLRADLQQDRLTVEVIDQGTGFKRVARHRDVDTVGGWGLNLVNDIASRWGIDEGASRVWFELDRGRLRLGSAANPVS